ncbi:hypothetical protein GWK47_020894 [Chionoecetes opilio]|uniref:C2H2-type domain-containing protein n=1 Tax=Chionoecetes opilio TaxID=41210 RepID=A0A8J4XTD7_CHIOP|nr:hypothetical protein GWK47_020894 [Chionoecetes opilio]
MDEVFGNSSSDTVMEAELSQVLETIRYDIASLHRHHHHHIPSSTNTNKAARTVSHPHATMLPPHMRVKPLDYPGQQLAPSRSCRGAQPPAVTGVRPIPYPRVISVATPSLRHTQSAVEARIPPFPNSPRPRAFSTGGSPQSHCYVNVNTCHRTSTYDNVPGPAPRVSQPATPFPTPHISAAPKYMNVPLSPYPSSSSAPTSPQRGHSKQRLHHSYIELWSGMQEERDSFSDSECEEMKRSFQEPQTPNSRPSPGYVQMTSPFIKSPQVTSPFNGSVLANFATKLASYAGQQPRNIFCPFCPRYFGYEKSLGSHLHKMHRVELNSMVENVCSDIQLQFCPICQAQFFNSSVLPKHLTDFHRASVIEVLEKNACIISDNMGIHCPFCTKMVPHGKTESPEPSATEPPPSGPQQQQRLVCDNDSSRVIPIRVDSLSAADFMDLTAKGGAQRKRRRLGLGLRSRKAFKKKDKENIAERELNTLASEASKIVSFGKKHESTVTPTIRTQSTRTFRRPKPVAVPRVPELPPAPKRVDSVTMGSTSKADKDEDNDSPFTNLKLYSPLRMFRCNGCHVKFCDNESLSGHIGVRHKGLLHLLRPQYGCGICSAKFFENKYLVKHCLQHHTSLLEIRSPSKHKVSIYRFPQD